MKDKLEYKKTYQSKIKDNFNFIEDSYRNLIDKIESISIPLKEPSGSVYLWAGDSLFIKTEINYIFQGDEEIPYIATATIEKQGENITENSEIEKILLNEGFKKIEEPLVQ